MATTPTEPGKRKRGKAQEAAVWVLMGMLILREPVGPVRLAGCAVLVGGVVLLSGG